MTAITRRFLHLRLRPVYSSYPFSPCHFSSSSDAAPPSASPPSESQPQSGSSVSSHFDEVKATLQREHSPQPSRKPLTFSKLTASRTPPPTRVAPLEEIRRNLSEFRSRSAPPPPSSASGPHVSLPEIYRKHVIHKDRDSAVSSESSEVKPLGGSFDSIRESLRQLQTKSPGSKNQGDSRGKVSDFLYRGGVNSQNAQTGSSMIIGGSGNLSAFLGRERSRIMEDNAAGRRIGFTKFSYVQLGEKLKTLRPEKKKGKWFTLSELNERLVKVRETEKQVQGMGVSMKDLTETLQELNRTAVEEPKKKQMQRLDILAQLGGTPSYMLSDPKDHLIEKYFHPDNMSSAEKLNLELTKVREEFKMSESDCGSARVQVAQLTTKIKHLSNVLAKKDKHSRRGLQAMVQRRKKLLKYLRRTDWDSYCLVLSKLGLRDNPDIKA